MGNCRKHTRTTFPGCLDGEVDVLDVHHRQPEGATHRSTKGPPAERVGGAGRHDHTTRSSGLGGTGDCAYIPWVPDTDQREHERAAGEDVAQCVRSMCRDGHRTGRGSDWAEGREHHVGGCDHLDAAGRQGVRQCRQFRVATTQLTARHDRDLERDTGLARVIDQSGAFEQELLSVRPTGACDCPEPRDEWVLPTCDRLHRERTRRTRNARAARAVSVPASASRA